MEPLKVDVIIPAFNEQESIGKVLADIPVNVVRDVYVCNNASTDNTAEVAARVGAIVLDQPIKGYGSACLKAIEHLINKAPEDQPDIIVFLDGDYSDHPEEMPELINPIVNEDFDLVIGSRVLGNLEKGAMMPQQIFGNWLATTLIRLLFNYKFTDLGPFRAVKWESLMEMQMADPNYGWTVEMQVKAARHKMKVREVAVSYRKRIGVSKVSGTLKGTILAGYKILWTIFKLL
ncbi:MAG: glycosyltransferase family 2 protein [Bacteroidetes bacterium]|nr:MAG: glycosyltransferase family 2 protein [Bacteroidota bacterium]